MTQPGGGSFAVDIAQAPKAIRELEEALEELRAIQRDAIVLGRVAPPTRDQVSFDAAQVLGQVANGGPGSLSRALTDGMTEISRTIESLRAGIAAYERSDEGAEAQFDSSS